ncbi:MAG: hypothetical protein U0694_03345 [Anaerolineae bacterium]
MNYSVEYLPGESIMIVRLGSEFTIDVAQRLLSDTAAYRGKVGGRVYRVTDCTQLHLSLQEFMTLLRAAQETAAANSSANLDDHVTSALVGNDEWVSLYRDALSAQQKMNSPIHATLEDALMSLRLSAERHNNVRDTQETPYIAPGEE